jgi:GNAT superfamily N-acetyltransferase
MRRAPGIGPEKPALREARTVSPCQRPMVPHRCAALEWAVGECRKRGCGLVQLTSDKRRSGAHSFYEGLGFRPDPRGL